MHPAEIFRIEEVRENKEYCFEGYTDGSKIEGNVGLGTVIYRNNRPWQTIKYRLDKRCSNNQAEQLAILKALEKIADIHNVSNNDKMVAIYTDSKITLDSIKDSRNYNTLIENIKRRLILMKNDNWLVHFKWVKAHVGIVGNEQADRLAKKAAQDPHSEVIYRKYPKTSVISEVKERSLVKWQTRWESSNKGLVTKAFFPTVAQRLKIKLQVSPELTTMITGHGKLRSYLNRFKIIDEPTCPCNDGEQTSDHLIFSCDNC